MRPLMATSLLALTAAIVGGCAPKAEAPPPLDAVGGWSIAPAGDLNRFFECLEEKDIALISAHRGGPAPGYPENALETMQATMQRLPAILEIDVAASADGVLFLMHDDTLDRTTSGDGAANAARWSEISALTLEDAFGAQTAFHPPRFDDVLSWAEGRTFLSIDFKRSARYEDVIAEIKNQQAEDHVILIAYTLAQARRLSRLAPGAMISLTLETQSDLNAAVAAGMPADRLIAFTGIEEPRPRLFSVLNNQDIEVIFGTLGGPDSIDRRIAAEGDEDTYAALAGMGVDIIATDRPDAAQQAIAAAGRAAVAGVCGVTRAS